MERFVTVLSLVAVLVGGYLYTNYAIEQNNRSWCTTLEALDVPNVGATTPRGVIVQRRIHYLRKKWC